VTTSLLESQIFMLDFQATRWLMDGQVAPQAGNDHPTGVPTGVFPTSDGHINIAASSDRIWQRLCDAIGRPDWKSRDEWKTQRNRGKNRASVNEAIAEETQHQPSAHWIETFEAAGIPCGPIYTIDQTFADPQVKHLGMTRTMESPALGTVELVASPINITGFSKDIRMPTPEMGVHTADVLREAGYTDDEIAELRRKGVI
jgi:formyl-CoA transferase